MVFYGQIPLLICGIISHVSSSIVDTQLGQVSGHFVNVDNGRDPVVPIEVFNAVPFGKDTSGDMRFAKPEFRDPWTGVFDATNLGTACPQSSGGVVDVTHPDWDDWGEDCLNVNIYTKNVAGGPGGLYPVMLWLYGGAFSSGANIQYPGHFLATRDVVVVVTNYRLEEFGFLFSNSDVVPGNMGLWDQNLALQFISNNIANFGGDPNKITIFGESAGAASTALHVLSPHSKDLFHQAIMESGAGPNLWTVAYNRNNTVDNLAFSLDCLGDTDEESLACLRTKTWQDIRENGSCSGCGTPVVDGPGGFVPDTPVNLRLQGNIMKGPLIAGINHDEASAALPSIVPGALFGCCNRSYYERILENRFVGVILFFADNKTQENTYHALDFAYSPWPNIYDNYQNRNALSRILTDVAFGFGWDAELKLHQDVAPTWGYVYNYRGRNTSRLLPEWMGVPHILEIPYVWGHTLLNFNPEVAEDSQMNFTDFNFVTEEDVRQTIFAQDLWTNFAKFGDPTPTPVDDPQGGTTYWPQFTWDEQNVLEIKNTSNDVINGYIPQDYAFWTEYIPYLVRDLPVGTYFDFPDEYPFPLFDMAQMSDFLTFVVDAKRNGLDLDFDDDWW